MKPHSEAVNPKTFSPMQKVPNTPAWFRLCAQRIADMPEVSISNEISILIVSTQRSGSKLLCDLLAGTELMGLPAEYLNPRAVSACAECDPRPSFLCGPIDRHERYPIPNRRTAGGGRVVRFEDPLSVYQPDVDLDAYLSFLRTRALTRNGVFSCNAHVDHLAYLERAGVDFRTLGFDKVIYLERMDAVAQAVSLAMSSKYDHWISNVVDPKPPDARVTLAEVLRGLAFLEDSRAFVEQRVRPVVDMTISYEAFREDYSLIADIPVRLGLCDRPPKIREPQLQRTAASTADRQVESVKKWLAALSDRIS